jgi:aminoglycoside/choline kinase family phosphotransferase
MVLVFNPLLLLATFAAMSHGYNFMPQFQSKFRKCVACTVLISSMGTSLPSISIADVKKDLLLEQEVKLAEKEAKEDAKVRFGILFNCCCE